MLGGLAASLPLQKRGPRGCEIIFRWESVVTIASLPLFGTAISFPIGQLNSPFRFHSSTLDHFLESLDLRVTEANPRNMKREHLALKNVTYSDGDCDAVTHSLTVNFI